MPILADTSACTFLGRPGHVRTVSRQPQRGIRIAGRSCRSERGAGPGGRHTNAPQRGVVLSRRATDARLGAPSYPHRRASHARTAARPARLAPSSYDKAQTKKVLKYARAEPMKEVGKAGYNVLVVEGCVFSLSRTGQDRTVPTDAGWFSIGANSPSSTKASAAASKSSTMLALPSPSPI